MITDLAKPLLGMAQCVPAGGVTDTLAGPAAATAP